MPWHQTVSRLLSTTAGYRKIITAREDIYADPMIQPLWKSSKRKTRSDQSEHCHTFCFLLLFCTSFALPVTCFLASPFSVWPYSLTLRCAYFFSSKCYQKWMQNNPIKSFPGWLLVATRCYCDSTTTMTSDLTPVCFYAPLGKVQYGASLKYSLIISSHKLTFQSM